MSGYHEVETKPLTLTLDEHLHFCQDIQIMLPFAAVVPFIGGDGGMI